MPAWSCCDDPPAPQVIVTAERNAVWQGTDGNSRTVWALAHTAAGTTVVWSADPWGFARSAAAVVLDSNNNAYLAAGTSLTSPDVKSYGIDGTARWTYTAPGNVIGAIGCDPSSPSGPAIAYSTGGNSYVRKLSAAGAVEWTSDLQEYMTAHGLGFTRVAAVDVTRTGRVYVFGTGSGSGPTTNALVIEIDADGTTRRHFEIVGQVGTSLPNATTMRLEDSPGNSPRVALGLGTTYFAEHWDLEAQGVRVIGMRIAERLFAPAYGTSSIRSIWLDTDFNAWAALGGGSYGLAKFDNGGNVTWLYRAHSDGRTVAKHESTVSAESEILWGYGSTIEMVSDAGTSPVSLWTWGAGDVISYGQGCAIYS